MSKFALSGAVGLKTKKGEVAANDIDDVKAVQRALNLHHRQISLLTLLDEDGNLGSKPENSKTVAAIKSFQQKMVGLSNPDGRVDVNGRTHLKLALKVAVQRPKASKLASIQSKNLKVVWPLQRNIIRRGLNNHTFGMVRNGGKRAHQVGICLLSPVRLVMRLLMGKLY